MKPIDKAWHTYLAYNTIPEPHRLHAMLAFKKGWEACQDAMLSECEVCMNKPALNPVEGGMLCDDCFDDHEQGGT